MAMTIAQLNTKVDTQVNLLNARIDSLTQVVADQDKRDADNLMAAIATLQANIRSVQLALENVGAIVGQHEIDNPSFNSRLLILEGKANEGEPSPDLNPDADQLIAERGTLKYAFSGTPEARGLFHATVSLVEQYLKDHPEVIQAMFPAPSPTPGG